MAVLISLQARLQQLHLDYMHRMCRSVASHAEKARETAAPARMYSSMSVVTTSQAGSSPSDMEM